MEDKKINEATSWGDIAEYQSAWKKFKAEKGGEAADAMEFIDAWCKEHPDMDNEDDRNGMFADISAMEESLNEAEVKKAGDDIFNIGTIEVKIGRGEDGKEVFAARPSHNYTSIKDLEDDLDAIKKCIAKVKELEGTEGVNPLGHSSKKNESLKEDFNIAEYHKAKETFVGLSNSLFDKYDGVTQEYLDELDAEAKKLLDAHKDSKEWTQAWKDFSEVDESLNEDKEDDKEESKEPKLETFDEQMDFLAADEQEAIDGYDKVIALVEDEHVKEQLKKILVEEKAHKEFLEKVKEDKTLEYSHEEHEEEKKEDEVKDEPLGDDDDMGLDLDVGMEVVDLDDIDDAFGEGLDEDTIKKGNKWVNKGKDGEHGEFKTKKEADAQRKAMFANGYHEDYDDDFGFNNPLTEEQEEEFGLKVNWDDIDDDDEKLFKKVIKNTDDDILDKHFGKDTPERKLVGVAKEFKEEAHETGHIKAKKPIELKTRRQ